MSTKTPDAFAGIDRLYGQGAYAVFQAAHVAVVGIGGVGSWVVESLTRSGIGQLTLADLDDICVSNTNRQVHTTTETIGQSKIEAMAARVQAIEPTVQLSLIHGFVTEHTVAQQIPEQVNYVIDCGDNQMAKSALIAHCRRLRVPVLTVGAAGGRIDPSKIRVRDLATTDGDALLASVRQTLRNRHGFSRTRGKRFSVPAVYSDEQTRYLQADGRIGQTKPGGASRLDCAGSLGAVTHVTATFGFYATARVLDDLLTQQPTVSDSASD
jgi:tRNA A37 threonylcarbamoyladenosine dehydratase